MFSRDTMSSTMLPCVLLLAVVSYAGAFKSGSIEKKECDENKFVICRDSGAGKVVPQFVTVKGNTVHDNQGNPEASTLGCYSFCTKDSNERVGCFKAGSGANEMWIPRRNNKGNTALSNALEASTTPCGQ